jgi:hypothetical protein
VLLELLERMCKVLYCNGLSVLLEVLSAELEEVHTSN